jgi:hypothetical protein
MLALVIFFSFPRILAELKKDPFTMRIYTGVNELEQKYQNNKFTLYSCSKKYESSYNSIVFSILFFLEQKNKYDDNGMKIGIERDCEYPKSSKPEKNYLNNKN